MKYITWLHKAAFGLALLAGCVFAPWTRSAEAARSLQPSEPSIPYAHRMVNRVPFVAFDTETTGLSAKFNSVVELAAVKYLDGKVIERKTWLINPGRPIPSGASRVHGITSEMVQDEPGFEEVYQEFLAFIDGSVLVAHNAGFDVDFMRTEILRCGLDLPPNRVIDSLALFRRWFPGFKSYNLAAIATELNANQGGFHRALADSDYVAAIFSQGAKANLPPHARLSELYHAAGGYLVF